jgi:hypothetical protein
MTEQVPAEQKDKILQSAYERLETYTADGVGVDRYSVDLKYWLEEQPGVAKATIRGGNTVTVEFEDATQVGILLDRLSHYGGDQGYFPLDPMVARPEIARLPGPWWRRRDWWRWWRRYPNTPDSTKALLFDPLYDDWPPESTTDSIADELEDAGYTVDKMLGDDGDLPHLETVESGDYGAIFIRSHGGMLVVDGNDKTHIMVRPFFDSYPDPAASGFNGIGVFYVGTNWGPKYTYAFNEEFVRHHLATASFPNSLMHLLVCHGGDPKGQDDLIDAFLDFGVGCYTGWTRNASALDGDPAAVAFFEYLCGSFGRTVAGAIRHIESLGHSPDPGTGADLVAYGDPTLSLRGFQRIVFEMRPEQVELIRKFPEEIIEVVIELAPGVEIPDWSPVGGKLTPVDRLGRRRFIPRDQLIDVFGLEQAMEEAIESFA